VKTVAYVRVSSKAQTHALQVAAIEREAAARGDVVGAWYAETMSGKALARPELAALRDDAQQGRMRRVYVFKLDRLTRSGVADTFKVVDELRRAGVELVAVADNMTIKPGEGDVASDVMLFALGLAAKIERTAINDRIAAARTRIEAEGGRWGRPSRVPRIDLVGILTMREAGKTVRQIAVATKIPRSTVARAIAEYAATSVGLTRAMLSQKVGRIYPVRAPRDPSSKGGATR
jgi:DNA invertase Pin-like site-specific DNA recombinase